MRQSSGPAALAERLCRPQRVGVFGHCGVGKTTLLTMLYREAVGGRLPGLRLAAADARTANYLSDKIHQLENGQPLPATLGETDLRFHLYRGPVRLELLLKDYQGEHVELGREEAIGEFLRDCDAVWLCLDAANAGEPSGFRIERLRRQQEVEQLLEQYLAVEPGTRMDRPVALVLTKADLLGARAADLGELADRQFDLVRHGLRTHCAQNDVFAVSSLGGDWRTAAAPDAPRPPLQPRNLDAPLTWLVGALQAQDEARLDRLWLTAGTPPAVLERCVACFARRYPDSPKTPVFQQRVRQQRRRRSLRRGLVVAAAVLGLLATLGIYDAFAYRQAAGFEHDNPADPEAVLRRWESYQTWHPTRNLLSAAAARTEDTHLAELRRQARARQRDRRWEELRRQAADLDADPEPVWQAFQAFHATYPEVDVEGDLKQLRQNLKARVDAERCRRARRAHDELLAGEQQTTDLLALLTQADRWLRDYAGTPHEADVRRRRDAYLTRLDDHDLEFARAYSARQPLNFQTRREAYQHYLDKHPTGAGAAEARAALAAIESDWDKHDFRAVRDLFLAKPGEVSELVARCRSYLAAHPNGRFVSVATDLLQWTEQVTAPHKYRVMVRSGDFEHRFARWYAHSMDLSVEIEVAGVRYGPTPVCAGRYDPEWEYDLPQGVRWKLGDPVRIRVTDHKWSPRVILEFASQDGDPLAIRMLSGQATNGSNTLLFWSDFNLPTLPKIE
jgi:GTPase SAR1 family protein